MDAAKEVEKEIKTEEIKRRRGRVYGRQETENGEEEVDTSIKGYSWNMYELYAHFPLMRNKQLVAA